MTAPVRVGAWRVWLRTRDEYDVRTRASRERTACADGDRDPWPGAGDGQRAATEWLALAERVATTETPWHRSKHAATYRTVAGGRDVYLKRYHRYRRRTVLKDMLRTSKARHLLRVSMQLAAAGFPVPYVLAVAGYTQSFSSVINPLVGLDTIRRMRGTYFKAFGMVLLVQREARLPQSR